MIIRRTDSTLLLMTQPVFWGYGTMGMPWTLLACLSLLIATASLLLWRGKRGLALPSQYVPWERIGSYALHDVATHCEVAIQYRTRLTFSGYPWELTLRCPTDRREALEAIMAQYVPPWQKLRFFPRRMP